MANRNPHQARLAKHRAKKALGVRSVKQAAETKGDKDVWFWVLPPLPFLAPPAPLSGEKKNVPNVKEPKTPHQNDTNGVVISDALQPGAVRNATASTGKNDADFPDDDFGHQPGSPCPKSIPIAPAELQGANEAPSFGTCPHTPGGKSGSPHEITQRDFYTSADGSASSDEGTGPRITAKDVGKQVAVPYKGGPCPRPGCDGTVIMGVAGQGTRLRCLCGWQEDVR